MTQRTSPSSPLTKRPASRRSLQGWRSWGSEISLHELGTPRSYLAEKDGVDVKSISSLTGFPEILDGRVKTLHPAVHGGILARRDKPEHLAELERNEIAPIELVCANLYPFRETISRADVTTELALENIDIGGPTMLRAAAKNHPWVLPLVDPADYGAALGYLRAGTVPMEYRR